MIPLRKNKNIFIATTLAGCLMAACISEGSLSDAPVAVMQYQNKPTEARLLDVAKSYAEAINANLDEGVIHPGLYAEYGVALARLGCLPQANTMFNNECHFFPNSRMYVKILKESLVPAYLADTLWDTTHINLTTLDTIAITYTPEELALQAQLSADPEYQKMLKAQQKEEREQQALDKKKERKEKERIRKEGQKAKQKAREQAKRDKEQAKRDAQRAKEDAVRAEQARQDSIARAERKLQKEEDRQRRKLQAEQDAQRREQERIAKKAARKQRREEFARKYEAWLIKNGYRQAPDSTDVGGKQ